MIYTGDLPPRLAVLAHFKKLIERTLTAVTQANDAMTANQMQLLMILGRPLTMKEVSEAINMHPSNLSVLVQGAVESGWVERQTSAADKRTKILVLTSQGTQIRSCIMDEIDKAVLASTRLDGRHREANPGPCQPVRCDLGRHAAVQIQPDG